MNSAPNRVSPDTIYSTECDVFAPCALGAVLNIRTIPQLKCKVIAGSANNQLETDADGELLFNKGIVYAPDYAINAGGLINVAAELEGYNHERVLEKVSMIGQTIDNILEESKRRSILPPKSCRSHRPNEIGLGSPAKTADQSFCGN